MAKGLVVATVHGGSIAEEMEITPGDLVLSVDGQDIRDIIDFQYYTADEEFTLLVEKPDGDVWEMEIERSPGEVLGLEFKTVGVEGLKFCKNNCVFCFVAQMPEGMRASLYDKDDDYRLSLTQGSFITLSNLDDEEFERILQLHLSPLYISVHAWDEEARVRLMKNPKAGNLSKQLKRLAEAGIAIHSQIVLVPGYNDGDVLEETVRELGKLYPSVQSIAVVPVGLTKFRANLPQLRNFTKEEAYHILENGHQWQKAFLEKTGKHLVYFSDEFYAEAQLDYPEAHVYDGFPQLENGVGMASKFRSEFDEAIKSLPASLPERKVNLMTGTSAKSLFEGMIRKLEEVQGLTVTPHSLENQYFGSTVTVAGLLTAHDIAKQVKELQGELFLIPAVMLKADENVFLDDKSVEWLEKQINGRALIVENDGFSFVEAVTGLNLEGKDSE